MISYYISLFFDKEGYILITFFLMIPADVTVSEAELLALPGWQVDAWPCLYLRKWVDTLFEIDLHRAKVEFQLPGGNVVEKLQVRFHWLFEKRLLSYSICKVRTCFVHMGVLVVDPMTCCLWSRVDHHIEWCDVFRGISWSRKCWIYCQ